MTKSNAVDAMGKLVEILTPLPSEERTRVIQAAMLLLGEAKPKLASTSDVVGGQDEQSHDLMRVPPRARAWMRQNGILDTEIEQVFHIADGRAEVIASHMPGRNKKEQTYNAYILTGVSELLLTGNPFFSDKAARGLCESSGCYDRANHSTHLRDRGNEFSGGKDKGWVLTAPGLKRAAEIIKEIVNG